VELHMNAPSQVVELVVAEVEDLDAFVVACLKETCVSADVLVIGSVFSVTMEGRPVMRLDFELFQIIFVLGQIEIRIPGDISVGQERCILLVLAFVNDVPPDRGVFLHDNQATVVVLELATNEDDILIIIWDDLRSHSNLYK
jgi:hypothetical protein